MGEKSVETSVVRGEQEDKTGQAKTPEKKGLGGSVPLSPKYLKYVKPPGEILFLKFFNNFNSLFTYK